MSEQTRRNHDDRSRQKLLDTSTSTSPDPQEARVIAKEAYIYAFPMAANYQTLYKQAIDTTSHDYRAPVNTLTNASSVATPEDKFVVTPNSDTPYSYLWMDLRAEPIVVTMPKHRERALLHRPAGRPLHV